MNEGRLGIVALAVLSLALAVSLGCSGNGAKSTPASSGGAYHAPAPAQPSQPAPQAETSQTAPAPAPSEPATQVSLPAEATPEAPAGHTVGEADPGKAAPGAEPTAAYNMKKAGNITFWWRVEGKMLHAKVSAPTTGWVAVGFDPKSAMQDANLILGYVKDGKVHVEDDFGTSQYSHASDVSLGGADNVSDAAGTETNGTTEISFTIPLDSGDKYDRVLVPGHNYKIILAHGANGVDDFFTHHAERKETSITL